MATPDAAKDGAYVMAQEILHRMNNISLVRGVDLPARQVIYPSAIPVDCAQVAIMFVGWVPTATAEGYAAAAGCIRFKWAVNFSVLILRETPSVMEKRRMPTADSMNEAGLIASNDADVLVDLVNTFGEIGPEFSLVAAAPEGGFQGVQLDVVLPQFGGLD